ncbi:hypothetical protein [Streptomyces sp. G7(2002)]|uniref:hypothetical protein n=1 Tax=Streptomyces sp. G7(2002) TaxID=2971798 RepID=UPI00237D3556|nr:hypothetical protein [Streptomyces sp. G7(2002)]WDT53924.1 hypothetical protein NUT86_07580 [Streptomyces sp. G7(2002)]
MSSDQALPHEVKVIGTAALLELEDRACQLSLNQRLDPAWVLENAAPEGTHYLWPAVWNSLPHRPEVPRQLRCELLLTLRSGERVMSLLDMLPNDFDPLPRVTSREEGMQVSRLLDHVPSVREWLLREDKGSSDRL